MVYIKDDERARPWNKQAVQGAWSAHLPYTAPAPRALGEPGTSHPEALSLGPASAGVQHTHSVSGNTSARMSPHISPS